MQKKNIFLYLSVLLAYIAVIVTPFSLEAAIFKPIVSGRCSGQAYDAGAGPTNTQACEWEDLIITGQNIITFAVYLVAILSVISIAYAGFLYATAGGNDSQISKAHGVFIKVIWGIFLTLGAWLIVFELLNWLGVGSEFRLLG